MAEIGKNIIENLTTAMYENSYTVYREYIQNSADSIDRAIEMGIMQREEAIIDIHIEFGKRRITINDNAAGIPRCDFYKKLSDIADSQKDPSKEKGFRGIGRLAGLAYCNKLIFKTSAKGEKITSIMEWDGEKLRGVLADSSAHPSASDLIDHIIECHEEQSDINEHFFEVVMDGVIPESDDLLEQSEVKRYLQAVAPIPYENSFVYRSKIYDYIKTEDLVIDEYDIEINGNPLFKPYKNKLYDGTIDKKTVYDEISDIEFRQFRAKDGRLLAWMWFAVTKYEKQIPVINQMRGIRLRKENIQIGDEETLSYPRFYKEARGAYYFIGELFAVDSELRPNARRDYFNRNATLKEFEDKVHPVLYKEFYDLYHYANKVKSSFKKTAEYKKKEQEYNNKINNSAFIDNKEKEEARKELDIEKAKAEKAKREIELRQKAAEKNSVLNRVFTEIETVYKLEEGDITKTADKSDEEESRKNKYLTQALSKYNRKEQKLIARIYQIIKAILPKDMAEMVVAKIQEELSK